MNTLVFSTALLGTLILVISPTLAEPPINQYLPPDQAYGLPNALQKPPPSVGSSRLGPEFGQDSNIGSNQYLPPHQGSPGAAIRGGFGESYNDNYNSVPAKYDFEYTVNDPPSGNDFGHKESRDGDFTRGLYFVLLPDGRRQMVEYEADQDGYRPKVTYMQVGSGIAAGNYPGVGELSGIDGYPSNALGGYFNAGQGGYPGGASRGYPSSSSENYSKGGKGSYPSVGQSGYRY